MFVNKKALFANGGANIPELERQPLISSVLQSSGALAKLFWHRVTTIESGQDWREICYPPP